MDAWSDDLTTRERIRKIALSLTRPRSVNWIKREADVASWDTTKDELERLVAYDQLERVEDDAGSETHTLYGPNYRRRYLERVDELVAEHAKDDLREEVATIQEQVEAWRATYDVESPDDLEASLTDDRPAEEIRERTRALRRWERSLETKRLLEHALSLYDDLEAVGEDSAGPRSGAVMQ